MKNNLKEGAKNIVTLGSSMDSESVLFVKEIVNQFTDQLNLATTAFTGVEGEILAKVKKLVTLNFCASMSVICGAIGNALEREADEIQSIVKNIDSSSNSDELATVTLRTGHIEGIIKMLAIVKAFLNAVTEDSSDEDAIKDLLKDLDIKTN